MLLECRPAVPGLGVGSFAPPRHTRCPATRAGGHRADSFQGLAPRPPPPPPPAFKLSPAAAHDLSSGQSSAFTPQGSGCANALGHHHHHHHHHLPRRPGAQLRRSPARRLQLHATFCSASAHPGAARRPRVAGSTGSSPARRVATLRLAWAFPEATCSSQVCTTRQAPSPTGHVDIASSPGAAENCSAALTHYRPVASPRTDPLHGRRAVPNYSPQT